MGKKVGGWNPSQRKLRKGSECQDWEARLGRGVGRSKQEDRARGTGLPRVRLGKSVAGGVPETGPPPQSCLELAQRRVKEGRQGCKRLLISQRRRNKGRTRQKRRVRTKPPGWQRKQGGLGPQLHVGRRQVRPRADSAALTGAILQPAKFKANVAAGLPSYRLASLALCASTCLWPKHLVS